MSVRTTYNPIPMPIASVELSCTDTPSDKLAVTRAYEGDTAFRLRMNSGRVLFASKQDILDLAEQLTTFANEVKR